MTDFERILKLGESLADEETAFPFGEEWTVLRRKSTKKMFAMLFIHDGKNYINLKSDPVDSVLLRDRFSSIIPAYHMNKEHWISVILDKTVPDDVIDELIMRSYNLVETSHGKKSKNTRENDW